MPPKGPGPDDNDSGAHDNDSGALGAGIPGEYKMKINLILTIYIHTYPQPL